MPEFNADGTTSDGTEDEVLEVPEEQEEPADEPNEGEEPEADEEQQEAEQAPAPKTKGKYRIGDQFFDTEAAALAFANQAVAPQPDAALNAYRQGIMDSAALKNTDGSVTPPEDDGGIPFDEEAYLTDPAGYMRKRDSMLITKAAETINSQSAIREQGNAIWNEFSTRHPELGEFRGETENFVSANKDEIQAMIRTKGRPAAYDFIALKMKSNFRKYQMLSKPTRTLQNGGGGASPTGSGRSVTPKIVKEKTMTFAEQIRQRKVK